MNNSQKKLIGSILCLTGLAILAYGSYDLYQVYDYNQSVKNVDESLGGIVSSLSNMVGTEVRSSYTLGLILAAVGLADLIVGWVILGKSK